MLPTSDALFKREMALVREMQGQTDRGVAIVAMAWVEEAIRDAIFSFLKDDKKSRERLFRQSGPLAALSAKIDLARMLGMTSSLVTSDLHLLRGIRNEFAHSILADDHTSLSFETEHIKDKCLALNTVAHEEVDGPRHAFIRACAVLQSDFYFHKLIGQQVADGGEIFAKVEHGHERARRAS